MSQITDAQYELQKLVVLRGSGDDEHFPWLLESDRLKELAIALVARLLHDRLVDADVLVTRIEKMGLLDVEELLLCNEPNNAARARALSFLREAGLSEDEAEKTLTVLTEVAIGLKQNFSGKIQAYLRRYGELILSEVPRFFKFTHLGDLEVREAFTFWLQNVTNMPVSLDDDQVRSYCAEHGFHASHLLDAADNLNINVALIDELIHRHYAALEVEKATLDSAPSRRRFA